jgi:DNA replication protein DnaD
MGAESQIDGAEESGKRVRHRLGVVGWPGFSPVPHLLLLHQDELGITSRELNVFLNIFMHWHEAARLPFPHTSTIAKRMGITPRAVQDAVRSLTKKGLLDKVRERRKDAIRYDVRPLLSKLQPRAKEWMALRGYEVPKASEKGELIDLL